MMDTKELEAMRQGASYGGDYTSHTQKADELYNLGIRQDSPNSAAIHLTSAIRELRKAVRALEMLRFCIAEKS